MKIGLIAPFKHKANTYFSNNARLRQFFAANKHVPGFFHPSLALLTIAALTPEDVALSLIDERVDGVDFEEDFDIVGISIITAQALRGYEIADRFRKKGVHVVIGGIHATVLSEEAAEHCDTLIAGEAENTWLQFISDYRCGSPRKLYREHSVDIGKSPVPKFELVDPNVFDLLPIQITRGCPHDCSFCSVTSVYGPRFRTKSVDQIVREIDAIRKVARNRRCVFNDDNTFVNRRMAYEILTAIKPLGVKYFAQTDISIADDEKLLRLLRESGCKTVFVGFESLAPENLASIQKSGWKLKRHKKYSESCKRIQDYGIQVLGSFVVGFDHDTKENLFKMRDFVLENKIWAQFLFLTPFPGTRVREQLIAQGRLSRLHCDWDLYTCFDAIFKPAKMTIPELEDSVLEIYDSVYSDQAAMQRTRHMVDRLKLMNNRHRKTG